MTNYSILQTACMTSRWYCHFAQHAYLKTPHVYYSYFVGRNNDVNMMSIVNGEWKFVKAVKRIAWWQENKHLINLQVIPKKILTVNNLDIMQVQQFHTQPLQIRLGLHLQI